MSNIMRKLYPKSFDENLNDYSQETTIHGIKYLSNRSRPAADRIFWIVIFVASVSFLGYFVYKIGRTWMENAVMINEENTPTLVIDIPFPSITVCPQIKMKRDKFDLSNLAVDINKFANHSDFMDNDLGKQFVMASQICRKSFARYAMPLVQESKAFEDVSGSGNLPNNWAKTLHDMSPSLDDVFDTCEMLSWNVDELHWNTASKKNCELLFSTIITNEGICFTFNTLNDVLRLDSLQTEFQYHNIKKERDGWNPEQGYTKANAYPYKGIVKGSPNGPAGVKIVLNANLSDVTPYCFPSNIGYKIALHSPTVYPRTYEKILSLEYGKEHKIVVLPKTIKTAENLRSMEPNVRQCFFNDERKLKFYTFYNEENCRLECYANYSTAINYGAPFSSPRDSNTRNSILRYKNFGWDLPKFFGLVNEHYKQYGTPTYIADVAEDVNCNCLPECNAINYDGKILKSNDYFSLHVSDEDDDENVKNRQTTIEIMFDEPSFIGQTRIRMYTFETMISDFGGIVGLFMGASVLSLFELFYFLVIRNCFKSKVETATD